MTKVIIFLLFAPLLSLAENSAPIRVIVQPNMPAKLRVYKEMEDQKIIKNVLVTDSIVPPGTEIQLEDNTALLYQWILNDLGKIIQSSMPYFSSRILSLPPDYQLSELQKERLLSETFYIHILDLDPASIIATLFDNKLPDGIPKIPFTTPWDSFNPYGTWSHAVQSSLRKYENRFLLQKPPKDIRSFCPKYSSLQLEERELFWIHLIANISYHESRFIPLTTFDEGKVDSSKDGIISTGLMQMSILSTKASCYQERGCNEIRDANDLFNPERNLECSIGIMSCLAERSKCVSCRQGKKWKGIAQYWSTMQEARVIQCKTCPGGKITIGKKKEIKEAIKSSLSFCF